jgi:hypothetical protein
METEQTDLVVIAWASAARMPPGSWLKPGCT